MSILWILLAGGAGACISFQAATNGALRMHLGDGRWATFFSVCGTIVTAMLVMVTLRPVAPSEAQFRSTEWWNWIGGPLGALIVFAGATLTPKMGAGSFIAAVVGGQVLCSICLDQFGLMNLARHPVNGGRILGAILVVSGVLLVTRN